MKERKGLAVNGWVALVIDLAILLEDLPEPERLDRLAVRPAALEVFGSIEVWVRRAAEREVFCQDRLCLASIVVLISGEDLADDLGCLGGRHSSTS